MVVISRARLETFRRCQRRFQLRYVKRLPWPEVPAPPAQVAARRDGELFHQLIAQDLLGMAGVDEGSSLPEPVAGWWTNYRRERPLLPVDGRLYVETTLSVPVGEFLLTGRMDLLAVADDRVDIVDWKTGRPRPVAELAADWQTRLYLALVVAGRAALGVPDLLPGGVRMTYWYAGWPRDRQVVSYSEEGHRRTWGEISETLALMGRHLAGPTDTVWPLTEDLTECAVCPYRIICGRDAMVAGRRPGESWAEDVEELEAAAESWAEIIAMEPDQP